MYTLHLARCTLYSVLCTLYSVLQGKDQENSPGKGENVKSELTNCTYLEDSSVLIEGIKIYGEERKIVLCMFT